MHALTVWLQAELLGRLALAAALGSVLGLEREIGRHPAGLRTHMLVSLGAAAYTVAGIYGVAGVFGSGFGSVQDPGRVAAQIITGIGFLGAGTIWRSSGEGRVIRGLTTAASIWVAASIGMLTGYGLYVLATGTALLSFTVLRLLRQLEWAPRALSNAVARRLRPARQMDNGMDRRSDGGMDLGVAYQPARAPAVMEAQPHAAGSNGQVAVSEPARPPDGAEPAAAELPGIDVGPAVKRSGRDRSNKKFRKGKKSRKGKQRDLSDEESDQISDAPELPMPSASGRH